MPDRERLRTLTKTLLVLAIIAAALWFVKPFNQKPPPSEPGYYTGPFRSKGNPNIWATDDGRIVPPPPGAAQSSAPKSPMPTAPRPGFQNLDL